MDGEDLFFNEYIKFETLYNELEVILDYDFMMKDLKHFNERRQSTPPRTPDDSQL